MLFWAQKRHVTDNTNWTHSEESNCIERNDSESFWSNCVRHKVLEWPEPILPIRRIHKLRRAPKHQGTPLLSKMISFEFLFLNWPAAMKTWMLIYCNALLSPFLHKMYSAFFTFNTTTEEPLTKAPNPQLLPGCHRIDCPLLRVCVHGVGVCQTFRKLQKMMSIQIEPFTPCVLFVT